MGSGGRGRAGGGGVKTVTCLIHGSVALGVAVNPRVSCGTRRCVYLLDLAHAAVAH